MCLTRNKLKQWQAKNQIPLKDQTISILNIGNCAFMIGYNHNICLSGLLS